MVEDKTWAPNIPPASRSGDYVHGECEWRMALPVWEGEHHRPIWRPLADKSQPSRLHGLGLVLSSEPVRDQGKDHHLSRCQNLSIYHVY